VAAAATVVVDPSGVSMPVGNIAGWNQTFSDDFTGTALNGSNWGAYAGQPGGDPNGWWDPSHVSLSGGQLVLRTFQDSTPNGQRWVSGGVGMTNTHSQAYGKYEVRMRVDGGKGISALASLWPTLTWPPEIDFYEDGPTGPTRQAMSATLHYNAANTQIQDTLSGVDFTQWHTIGVEWTPGSLVYTIDGRTWATVATSNVPSQPMNLDLQTQALTCSTSFTGCPDATTPAEVDMDVDWAVAYQTSAVAPQPAAGPVVSSASRMALTVHGGTKTAGAPVTQVTYVQSTDQNWAIPASGTTGEIVNQYSAMCLTTNGRAGGQLIQEPCVTNQANEQWARSAVSGSVAWSYVNPGSGLAVDVAGQSTASGAAIDGWLPNGQLNQSFQG
jgi:beta-glucanase (GH16 family)